MARTDANAHVLTSLDFFGGMFYHLFTALPAIYRYLIYINSSAGMRASKTASAPPFLRAFFLWKYFAEYFPARITKMQDLPAAGGPYCFVVSPHGVCVFRFVPFSD